jgi:5-methyltetrahydropteroyltriglutamate--homocysteine methyltransferase
MAEIPVKTSVVGSYPFPGWLEFASGNLDKFGTDDIREMQEDAVVAAIQDQVRAGLDVITDGEQSRFDFNLSFYGYLDGISLESASPRRWGPPAHDQRGKHEITGELKAPRGLGAVEEFKRLKTLAPPGVALKASLPGPFTLSGRLLPNKDYPDRYAITEALLPIIQKEMEDLVEAGCREICLDEPSMSCYGHREDPARFVDIFNRTVEPVVGKTRLASHLCFGNYKGRAVGSRRAHHLFPRFLDLKVNEMHIEMATTLWQEMPLIEAVAKKMDVAIGLIDVKSYHIEDPTHLAAVIRRALEFAPADRLVVAPDCGLSQTARWAARKKLSAMVEAAHIARKAL